MVTDDDGNDDEIISTLMMIMEIMIMIFISCYSRNSNEYDNKNDNADKKLNH